MQLECRDSEFAGGKLQNKSQDQVVEQTCSLAWCAMDQNSVRHPNFGLQQHGVEPFLSTRPPPIDQGKCSYGYQEADNIPAFRVRTVTSWRCYGQPPT